MGAMRAEVHPRKRRAESLQAARCEIGATKKDPSFTHVQPGSSILFPCLRHAPDTNALIRRLTDPAAFAA